MSATSGGEDAWLADAFRRLPPSDTGVLGLGHDCEAVRVAADGLVVVAKDVLVDGVHMRVATCGAAAAARKALAVNLSDLAAAAAVPIGFLVGAVLPRPVERVLFDELMRGFGAASVEFDCPCLGGDTNVADGPLVLSVTVLGRPGPMGVLSRAGALPGDVLSVTGPLGGSAEGRHLTFVPRLAEASALAAHGVPHAQMDLSDGLSRDLPRLCRASGVGACVAAAALPIHPHAQALEGRTPLERALHDGEDFELLVAHAPLAAATILALAAAGTTLIPIGEVRADPAVLLADARGEQPLEPRGWDHLAG